MTAVGQESFIEKGYFPGVEPKELFMECVLPHVQQAFRCWRDIMLLRGNAAIVGAADNIPLSVPPDHFFQASISDYAVPQSREEFGQILTAWEQLMDYDSWDPKIPNQPYVVDLTKIDPVIVGKLPKIIVLGNTRLIRLMDSFYVPDKTGANWSETLFEYLGPDRYEKIADLELKEAIDKILLGNIKGCVLDIGCGSGLLQQWINKSHRDNSVLLLGIDLSKSMLKKARERGERAIEGNMATLSGEEILMKFEQNGYIINAFNYAVMSYVDNWLTPDERERIFKTVCVLLVPNGRFSLNVYNLQDGWQSYYRELAKKMGFKQVRTFTRTLPSRDGSRTVGFVFAYK